MEKSNVLIELKAKIREERWTVKLLASKVGINDKTLGAKLNGQYAFTLDEAFQLSEILGIPDVKIRFYFFTH